MARSRLISNVPIRPFGMAAAALLTIALAGAAPDADARPGKRKRHRGKALVVQSVNVARQSGIAANAVVEMVFSSNVDPRTVNAAQIQILGANASRTGFTRQAFGTFQVSGNVVRFFPRLPTHLRDPDNSRGGFYPLGSDRDDAVSNAGFAPSTDYELRISGQDALAPVRSQRGRPLRRSFVARFSTAAAVRPAELYTLESFADSPPPRIAFTNPPDASASVAAQYARAGGTFDVPSDIRISLFGTKVPLSPTTLRVVGNVRLDSVSRGGDRSLARPVDAGVFVEQNSDSTQLVVQPRVPLADRGTYTLRITKRVQDLTEQFDLAANVERSRLRAMYDWLSAARAADPSASPEELPDPPVELTIDWPSLSDPTARGILKRNLLALGDSAPEEIDPRVFALFTVRDEPVTNAVFDVNFLRGEDLFDATLSTGEVDRAVPGAASAILTVAGGSGANGDLLPEVDTILDTDQFVGGVANFRDVVIPPGVTVQLRGSRPVVLRALSFTVEGELTADGAQGGNARNGSYDTAYPPDPASKGGRGGAGGGAGADSGGYYYHPTQTGSGTTSSGSTYTVGADRTRAVAGTGATGISFAGVDVDADDAGQGGLGGRTGTGTSYNFGGAGGGGGARLPGSAGAGTTSGTASWNGAGGGGGAGSTNDDLDPLVGGAGAGSGGNATWGNGTWSKTGGGGGGGGGAVQIQTARDITIGIQGVIATRGGRGGNGTGSSGTLNAGPGGGGGGGSLLLRTTGDIEIADPTGALVVTGGAGGTHTGASVATSGGAGGAGYLRLEDPQGGPVIAGATSGTFDPVGGGVPSVVYTKFADLGVADPRLLAFGLGDVETEPTSNDAIVVEMQMTSEHPSLFGKPDTTSIDENQNSTDTDTASRWIPVKVHDNTGVPGGALRVPGWNPAIQGSEAVLPVDELNGHGYRFVRYRVTFQLDDAHARTDALPYVERIRLNFQFNF